MHSKGTFRKIVEIPMRTTGAPLIVDLFFILVMNPNI
jgi:hypothetical protein